MSRRRAAILVALVAVILPAGAALAAWTASSTGSGSSQARSLPAGPTPSATASSATVTVSFPQVSLNGAVLGSLTGGGYTIKRYDSGGTAQTVKSACNTTISGSGATLNCAEINVLDGTWYYKVTPVLSGWKGAEGSSGSVTVSAAPPAPSTPALAAVSDTGSSSSDRITNDQTPTVTGTAQTGAIVTIYDGTTAVGSVTASGSSYSVTTSTLTEGVHSLTAKAANAAGSNSAGSGALSITIDVTAPAVSVTSLGSGGSTSKVKVTGTGSATDGSITVNLCHTASCSTSAATGTVSGATWTYTSGNIGNGIYYAVALQTDTAGNTAQTPAYGPYTR